MCYCDGHYFWRPKHTIFYVHNLLTYQSMAAVVVTTRPTDIYFWPCIPYVTLEKDCVTFIRHWFPHHFRPLTLVKCKQTRELLKSTSGRFYANGLELSLNNPAVMTFETTNH